MREMPRRGSVGRVALAAALSVACLLSPADVFYVSSQGEKGWIKDAQTLEDFRYAATNDFDYVTFEVGARKLPAGWFDEVLPAIAGSGKKPWLVLNKSFVSGKSAPKDFETLAKAGFKDADVVVEANDVALLKRYTAEHPDVKRVLSVGLRYDRATRRLRRVPQPAGVDPALEPWPSILKDALAAEAWGVRLPSMQFRVQKQTIDELHAAGIKVIMGPVNEPVTGGYYRRAGADAFVTVQPAFTRGPREEWPKGEPNKTLLFGHRGGEDGLAPEHSPALTRLAVEHKMDIIKLDLQRTKDGEIVTSHDSSLKRVFGVDKVISQMTLAELKELVALPVAGYTNEHIQTLAEVLSIAKDGIPQFGLDFKAFTPEMAEKALAIIAEAGVSEDRVFIITYTLKALAYMKEHHPNVRRVMHTSVYYLPRENRWQVYQDVPGHVGVVAKKGTPALTYATSREACQRILDFYKKEYGLYGINIGVFVGGSCGPFGWFRVSAEDMAFLRAGGLWVSVYMPTDPVTCDYYRRAGADAFITASAADTVFPIEVRVRKTSGGPQVFVDGQAVRPRFYYGSPANLCNMAWTWETQFNVPFRAEEDTESGRVELPLYAGEKPIDFYDADLIDLTAGTTNFLGGRVHTDRYACDGLKLRKGHLYRFRVKNRADHDRTYFHYRTTYVRADGTRVELPLPYGDTLGDTVALAAGAGVDLVTFSTDNSWGCDDWWNEAGDESGFARLDALCERLIKINPKILLIPRIIGNAPDWFLEKHPESRMKFDRAYKVAMVSVSYRPYRQAVCEMVEKLVRHLQRRFPRNFAGLHVGGQNSAEWFYFNSMSGDVSGYDVGTRDAFRDYLAARGEADAATAEVPTPEERRRIRPGNVLDPVADRRLVDFVTFRQQEIASLLRDIGEAIRRGSDGKCLSLFFYGYTWELGSHALGSGELGHDAMEWLQREGGHAVDGFSGPFSYNDRNLTGSASVMSAAQSCARRGFLWINEEDARTCREEFWDNHSRLFTPHADRWTTEQILLRDSISGILRGTGEWWMDLFGRGWHRDAELWKIRKALNPIDDRLLRRARPYEPEIAAVMDDDSLILNAAGSNAFMTRLRRRDGYARCGGTYGQYFFDDLMAAPPASVKLVYLLSCKLTESRRAKLEAFKAAHPYVRVVEATPADIEAEAVAAHARAAGVHLYTEPNRAFIEAAEGYVMVQARQDGPLDIDFGVTGEIRDALTGKIVGSGPKLTREMKRGEVRLFRTTAERQGVALEVCGDWLVSVRDGEKAATLTIDPPELRQVADERHDALPPPGSKRRYAMPCKLNGVRAYECSVKGALVTGSARLRGEDGVALKAGTDYLLDETWGGVESVSNAPATGLPFRADYAYRLSRIDSIVRKKGRVELRKGDSHVANPAPPALASDEVRLANVYVRASDQRLAQGSLYPVLEREPNVVRLAHPTAERLLPKTWRKLNEGGDVNILCWGDSVTAGGYLPESDRWTAQFLRRLKSRFPQAKITLRTVAWPGRKSVDFLGKPSDDPHCYESQVLGEKPDLIISEFVNDAALSQEQTRVNYSRYLSDFKSVGAEWLIVVPHYVWPAWMGAAFRDEEGFVADSRPHVAALRRFADEHAVPLADASWRWGHLRLEGLPYETLFCNAVNHPNRRGMRFFADALMETFGGDGGFDDVLPALTVNGVTCRVERARCSAFPYNRRWPGYQRPLDQTEICGFASLTLGEKPLAVEMTTDRCLRKVTVRPLSKGITAAVDGRKIRFTVTQPGAYAVEADGPNRAFFLFIDPKPDFAVDRADPKTRYFGPGEHDAGIIELKSGETLFLDEGAVVYGRVVACDADDIRILGRGILDGSRVKEEYVRNDPVKDREEAEKGFAICNAWRYDAIRLDFCDRVQIKGIVIRDSPLYTIRPVGCRDLEIAHVKVIGNWRYNSDGFDMHNCRKVRIHDCFLRTYDDSICIKGFDYAMDESDMLHDGELHDVFEDVLVERCVIWNDWGRSLEIGAETRAKEIRDVTFRDCDLIHLTHAACDIQNVDYAAVRNVLYDDIRLEYGDTNLRPLIQRSDEAPYADQGNGGYLPPAMCALVLYAPEYSAGGVRRGTIDGVTYRNLRIAAPAMPPSLFRGFDEKHRCTNIVMDGIYLNGKRVTAAESNAKAEDFAEFAWH